MGGGRVRKPLTVKSIVSAHSTWSAAMPELFQLMTVKHLPQMEVRQLVSIN